jgi:hypothetical protein
MNKITQFNRQNLNEIRTRINIALKDLGAEMGINISIGAIRYGEFEFTTKLSAKVDSPEAQVAQQQILPSWLVVGKVVTLQGRQYKLTGYNPRRFKFPVLATDILSGKGVCLKAEVCR